MKLTVLPENRFGNRTGDPLIAGPTPNQSSHPVHYICKNMLVRVIHPYNWLANMAEKETLIKIHTRLVCQKFASSEDGANLAS